MRSKSFLGTYAIVTAGIAGSLFLGGPKVAMATELDGQLPGVGQNESGVVEEKANPTENQQDKKQEIPKEEIEGPADPVDKEAGYDETVVGNVEDGPASNGAPNQPIGDSNDVSKADPVKETPSVDQASDNLSDAANAANAANANAVASDVSDKQKLTEPVKDANAKQGAKVELELASAKANPKAPANATIAPATEVVIETTTPAVNRSIEEGVYVISSALSENLALDVATASEKDRVNVQMRTLDNSLRQRWLLKYDSDGFVILKNMLSGAALDVFGGRRKSRTNVHQYHENGSDAQKWLPVSVGNGRYVLRSALDPNLVLDVYGAGTKSGTNVWIYQRNGSLAQTFLFTPVSYAQAVERVLEDGYYTIRTSLNSDCVLDIRSGSTADGANVQIFSDNSSTAQVFYLQYEDGYYHITNVKSNKRVVASGYGTKIRTNVCQQTSSAAASQDWAIKRDGTCYRIVNRASGLALDVYNGEGRPSTNVWLYRQNSSLAQAWYIQLYEPVENGCVYSIQSAKNAKVAVSASGNSNWFGRNVQLSTYSGDFSEKWIAHRQSDGSFAFESVASGRYLGLVGSNVHETTKRGDGSTSWILTPSSSGIRFENKKTGQMMDVNGGKARAKTNIKLWKANGSVAQAFMLNRRNLLEESAYTIALANNGRLIDVRSGSTKANAAIQLFHSNGSAAQKWFVVNNYDGSATFVSAKSGLALSSDGNGRIVQKSVGGGKDLAHRWVVRPSGSGTFILQSMGNDQLSLSLKSGGDRADANLARNATLNQFVFKRASAKRPAGLKSEARSISFCDGARTMVDRGSQLRLAIDLSPRTVTGTQISFDVADPTIVSVDSHGTINALRAGATTVTARLKGSTGASASISVVVRENRGLITNDMLSGINLNAVDSLMIVAHPDDETFWGGAHLIEGNYLVVCMTNGSNPVRSLEYNRAMDLSNSERLILSYPDADNHGERDGWNYCSTGIANDLQKLLSLKSWTTIATHNPQGDTGHMQHKLVNSLVTKACKNASCVDRLWYFGQFYSAGSKELAKLEPNVSGEVLSRKLQMANLYTAEATPYNLYWKQMMPHEHWVKA
ncbi:MAG: RICIN domain-containing protein [Atopobiaceae bacterium]|nr:RICIN domain-containing protein [Atopobiaceae bacterium]